MATHAQKKLKKAGDSSNGVEAGEKNHNDEEIQKSLEEVDLCQNDIDSLNQQASEEILQTEMKYNSLRKPLYEKRNLLINKIPHFWVTAFANHPDLSALLGDTEEDCLHHLTMINVEEFEDIKSGFKIEFHFEENPYFHNRILTKEYHLASVDEPVSKSTEIKWKDGFDLSQTKQNPPKSSRKRRLEQKSFFTWFNDHSDPLSDDIAEVIKDDLWMNPLQYFLVPDGVDNGVDEDEASEAEDDNEEGEDVAADNTDDETTEQSGVADEASNA